ncbi:MAG: TonB-dependent receptor [Dysgonamonadaceae bacterium]|jgi:TonB-linked SusC/RagA family outer membrane protein|nr:TonB-dependent receptor [Dysgonamonadaceae bacterium]
MKKESLSKFRYFGKTHQKTALFILFLFLSCNSVVFAGSENNAGAGLMDAQQEPVRISGVVSDESGPLPGVSVAVKASSQRATTGLDGKFSISIPNDDAVLVFSFIGYTSLEVPVKNKTDWNIIMKEDEQIMDEAVVVGYGTQKKVNLTGAVAAVKFDENISSRSLTNVSSGLSGLVPGLTVMQTTGFAGFDGAGLKIRGLGSVNGNSSPLIVVDGMPDVDINRININDIESVSVLKDAASSAVYGSRAANGVILITTKTGKDQSKAKISYTGSYGVSDPTNFYDYLADYPRAMLLERRAGLTGNRSSGFREGSIEQWMAMSLVDPILFPNTDQFDAMFRQGSVQNHNISASGGTDKVNFYLSAGVMDQKGLQLNNNYDRYNMRFNLDYKIRDNISVGIRTDGQWTQTDYPRGAGLENGGLRYAVSGILNKHPETGQYGGAMAYGENSAAGNMLAEYELYSNERTRQEYNANIYGDWEIIKGLKFNIGYALRYYNQFTKSYQNVDSQWNFQTGLLARTMPPDDGMSNTITQGHKTLFSGSLNYNKRFNDIHELTVMVAGTEEYWFNRSLTAGRKDRLDPSLTELDAASASQQTNGGSSDDEGLRSFIGRVNYSFKDKYLFEANFRYDGSSKFTPGHQWGFFPSAAVGWRISEENFFEGLKDKVSNLKFRGSYGSLGNNSGSIIGRYEQKNTFATTNYILNGSIVKGFSANKMINPDLSWESTDVINIGLDLGLLKNRLTLELDWYDRLTKGMIRGSDLSTLLSAYSAPRVNIGEMRNRGLEANITWKSKVNEFNYSVNLNASYNQNRLEKWNEYLSKGWTFIDMPYQFLYTMEAYPGLIQSWNQIYNAPYQSSQYMAPGDVMIKDLNGDGQANDEDKKAYSDRYRNEPVGQFGLNLYGAYKGFDLSALFQASTGRWDFWLDYYNETNVPADRMGFQEFHWNDTWTLDNRGATLPRILTGDGGSRNRSESTYTLYDASYLRLKNLQLGYSIPTSILKKISIDRIRIYATAENILTFSDWPGVDPEKPKGDNIDIYPLIKTYSIGINIGF